jgi:hypothetical protein
LSIVDLKRISIYIRREIPGRGNLVHLRAGSKSTWCSPEQNTKGEGYPGVTEYYRREIAFIPAGYLMEGPAIRGIGHGLSIASGKKRTQGSSIEPILFSLFI